MDSKIKIGDIVLFKAEDEILSKTIAVLTNSDVSHSAMVYGDNCIVEMAGRGIRTREIDIMGAKKDLYIRRLKSEVDVEKLISMADKYLDAKTKFDFPDLFFIALLIIYRKIVPTTKLINSIYNLLKKACINLDEKINLMLFPKTEYVMVCTELVYQVYEDCGKDSTLIIENGILQNQITNDGFSIINYLNSGEFDEASVKDMDDTLDQISNESILEDLLINLEESYQSNITDGFDFESSKVQNVLKCSKYFLNLTDKYFKILGVNKPLEALFVTPEDLKNHCINVDSIKL